MFQSLLTSKNFLAVPCSKIQLFPFFFSAFFSQQYCLVPNRRPSGNYFFKLFPARSFYSNPLAIKFWEKFHSTQAFKIYIRFAQMKIKTILLKKQKSLLNLREFSNTPLAPIPLVIRFCRFFQASQLFQRPLKRHQRVGAEIWDKKLIYFQDWHWIVTKAWYNSITKVLASPCIFILYTSIPCYKTSIPWCCILISKFSDTWIAFMSL